MPKLTFLGHSAFLLEGNSNRLVIDPFLTGNPLAKTSPEQIAVDFVVLTHGHGDHLGDALAIAKNNDATIIAVFELANYCSAQGAKVHDMSIGGGHDFDFGHLKFTIAHHGSSNPQGQYMGQPAGVLIRMDDKLLYHAGDTALFYDMKLIGELNPIDLAILPIGDNYTMGIDDAVHAATFLKPRRVVPMHYNTFEVIQADPRRFVSLLEKKGITGTVLEVDGSLDF